MENTKAKDSKQTNEFKLQDHSDPAKRINFQISIFPDSIISSYKN